MNHPATNEEQVRLRQPTAGHYLQIQSVLASNGEPQSIILLWQPHSEAGTAMSRLAARKVSSAYILLSGNYDIAIESIEGGAE